MSDIFDKAFTIVVGEEGGLSNDPRDAGNWTGGKSGTGQLRGTKYGISAAAYPSVDIANLTIDDAKKIYLADYWNKLLADALPPAVAVIAFDGAVNSGVERSARWLQAAVGVGVDGTVGPITVSAANAAPLSRVIVECLSARALFLAALPTWPTYGLGWTRRLLNLALAAEALAGHAAAVPTQPAPPAITMDQLKSAFTAWMSETRSAA